MAAREETFARLVADAETDDGVLGLFVFGSRGRDVVTDDSSDYDVAVIVRDGAALAAFDQRWPYKHGADVEIVTGTIDDLREHASIGGDREWARYQYAHLEPLLDKTEGDLQRIIDAKERIPDHLRDTVVRPALGAYVNSTHRSLRNASLGLTRAARLDAADSIPSLLTVIFGLEGRVRPFNKYLEWELRHHSLANADWTHDRLVGLLDSVIAGETSAQHELFKSVERSARDAGYGDEIDGWEPDLEWLRGESSYRAAP